MAIAFRPVVFVLQGAAVVPVAPAPPATLAVVGAPIPIPVPAVVQGIDWTVLIPLLVTGASILLGQYLNWLKSNQNGQKADAIHVLVNSGMSKALADNASQAEEIRGLRALVQALDGRVAALPEVSVAIRPDGVVSVDHPSRADIEKAQAVIDAGRLPSADVLAAQASTPKATP